ncbi:hypothetical protein [Pseudobacteriovorax antillogorgiicola]|uniref:Lipoprotein n=1 Tax=Pseudobacteriovorax antillogorgiicola TaxID=1513793 RepID=A0A1Y6CHD8_9BACT|nr:hypothetical protein [Pseudobacteriovorax antillogorgiicola]TCS48646.1 hypothetical protein EDD56_11768 [Pseudobacteriovorax antillogorgiicola]SMF55255.1 hypothetical protein SAMN06296036_11791 [Pseudobacteriovorax antillogorgiicola]
MWFKRAIGLASLCLALNACVTPIETKPRGYAKADTIGKDVEKPLEKKELLSSLSRSYLHESGIYQSLYIEAMLKTPVLEYQKLKQEATAQKWTDEQIKEKLGGVKKSYKKKVCFDLLIKSNDKAATDPKTWKITLKQGKNKATRRKIAEFKEQTPNSVFASVDRTFDHVKNDMQFFLETELCFKKKSEFDDELVLKVMPKFNDEVDEVVLSWWFE